MRLTSKEREIIVETVRTELGPETQVLLFGSRVDDAARGGDIDLLVHTEHCVENPAMSASRLAVTLERLLEGRRVDVVLVTPATPRRPIHEIAFQTGIRL